MTLHVKEITVDTLPEFGTLRHADEVECAAGGMTGREAIDKSLRASFLAYAIYGNEELLAFWGFRPATLTGNSAAMWMMSFPGMDKHQVAFARYSMRVVQDMLDIYGELFVTVHYAHTLARKWLHWLGFKQQNDFGVFKEMRVSKGDFPWAS